MTTKKEQDFMRCPNCDLILSKSEPFLRYCRRCGVELDKCNVMPEHIKAVIQLMRGKIDIFIVEMVDELIKQFQEYGLSTKRSDFLKYFKSNVSDGFFSAMEEVDKEEEK